MLFRILGRVAAIDDDEVERAIGARRQRALLARLVLDANRVVASSALVESVWGDDLPRHPEAALQVVVSRLRTGLGACGRRIVADAAGYRLEAGPEEIDVLWVESLLRDGRLALASNEAARAADLLDQALSLWDGDALQGLEEFSFSVEAAHRLHQLRVTVVEARNDAYLNDGRHLEVLADVDEWVASEPLREHLRAQQIAALYRAGRQAEAMRACESLRKALRDEVGLNPSVEIQQLERRVLNQDPGLVATDGGFMTALPAWTSELLAYVGRDTQYQEVLRCFGEAVEGNTRLALVDGAPGVGKSRFLLQLARRLARDAIVLPIHVQDVFSPALLSVARVIAEATLSLSEAELTALVANVGVQPGDVARIREISANLVSGDSVAGIVRDEDILRDAARWIAALSWKAPLVVIVVDIVTASPSVLHVISQLASLSVPKRVLIVGSLRGRVEWTSPDLVRMTSGLEATGCVARIELPPLSADDIDELLTRMRVDPREALVTRLDELTGGNALLLAEMLNTGPPERVVSEWSSPPRVRDLVRKRTAELGRATADILKQASLFLHDFTVELLAEAAGTTTGTTEILVDRAVDAHVLQPSTMHSYRFAHQLFAHAIAADLSADQRADGHRRIACALEHRGSTAALLAAHWSAATGLDVPAKVLSYARIAGRESMRMLEPTAAVKWFELALAYVSDPADRGPLLGELAEAKQFAGDPTCIESLQEAVRFALLANDDALTLQIVRATTPGWSTFQGVTGLDTRLLLARALEVVDDDDLATRSRILARIAIDLSVSDPCAAEDTADEAVRFARKSGARAALLESLMARASFSMTPHSLTTRRVALREIRTLSSRATDVVTRYFALSASVVAAIQSCDPTEAETSGSEADAIAAHYDLAPLQWSTLARRAWRSGLAGQLDVADELIQEAWEYGDAHGVSHARQAARLQRATLRWQQGRLGERLHVAREFHAAYASHAPGVAVVLAGALADHASGRDEARALLLELSRDRFARLPMGTFWSSALILAADVAAIVELPDVSATIRDLLEPFVDQVAFTGLWVTAPIAHGVAVAAAGCGDTRAPKFFRHAAEIAERIHAPVLAARAREHPLAKRR